MANKALLLPSNRLFNNSNIAAPGGTASLYLSGTTTPADFLAADGTTSLGSTITANGIGQLPDAYGDETVAYRVILKDTLGATLNGGDIDPFHFGIDNVAITSASGQSVSARSGLAAILAPIAGQSAILTESGREGTFVFSTANLSAQVTADPQQGSYVAPASDATGASGAWVRTPSYPLDVLNAGATKSTTVDSNPAFQNVAVEDRGHAITIPASQYRISASSIYRGLVKIEGDGWGQNPGTVDGVSYPYPNFYNGSVIYSDAGVTAIEFQPFTSLTDVATVTGNMAAAETQQSAYGSGLRDIAIVSAGNGAVHAGKPLIYSRTKIYVDGVLVAGGGAEGLRIEANSVDISSPFPAYGNANGSVISRSSFINNAGDGLLLGGSDTNAIITFGCTFQNNGGFGLNDQSFLGGVHIGNIWEPNTGGSIKTGANTPALILGGDIEGGLTDLGAQTMVIGGIAAADARHPADCPAFVFNAGQAIRKGISGLNNLGAISVVAGVGRDPSYTPGGKIAFWFGSLNDAGALNGDAFKLKYEFQWTGIWSLNYRNTLELMEFPSGQTSFYGSLTNAMAVGFPNGLAMGTINSAPRLLPAASSIPTTGTYRQGDWVPNAAPAISAGKVLLGWSRLTTGSANVSGTDWTPVYGTTS